MGYSGGSVRQGVISVSDHSRPDIASVTPGFEALGSAPLRGPLVGLRGGWGDRCGKLYYNHGFFKLVSTIKH